MLMPASLNVLPVLFLNFLERVKNKEGKGAVEGQRYLLLATGKKCSHIFFPLWRIQKLKQRLY